MKLLLDLDGVCANFVKAICKEHGRPDPYTEAENLGCYNMAHLWGMPEEKFYAPLNNIKWWVNVDPMPDLPAIKELIFKYFKVEDICILSEPPSIAPLAMIGKWIWCKDHLPEIKNRLFGTTKDFCACENIILLDDDQYKIDRFRMAGGRGVLMPRPWNPLFDRSGELAFVEVNFEAMFVKPVSEYC